LILQGQESPRTPGRFNQKRQARDRAAQQDAAERLGRPEIGEQVPGSAVTLREQAAGAHDGGDGRTDRCQRDGNGGDREDAETIG
jgi:hypothetical protein